MLITLQYLDLIIINVNVSTTVAHHAKEIQMFDSFDYSSSHIFT